MMDLNGVKDVVKAQVSELLATSLPDAIRVEPEFQVLKSIVPYISQIKMKSGWSGFNDGDAEYKLPVPLFIDYASDVDEAFKSAYSGEGWDVDWDENTEHDDMIYAAAAALDENEFKEFIRSYNNLCEKIHGVVGDYYEFDDLMIFEV